MVNFLLVGFGGFIGSTVRYYFGGWVHTILDKFDFPYGTIAINILGCFIIGFLGGLGESKEVFSPEARLFLFIGVLGGFTTFSTFGYESFKLINGGQTIAGLINVLIQVVFGLLFVWLGNILSKLIWG